MRLGPVPENPLEWLVLRLGFVPRGLVESGLGILLTRAMMAGTKLGVFESLADQPLTAS